MFGRFLIILWLLPFVILGGEQSLFAQSTPEPTSSPSTDYQVFVPGEIVIKARPDVTLDKITSLNKAHGAEILERNSTLGFYRLKVSEPVEKATISYQAHPAVGYALPNYIFAEVGKEFITLFDLDLTIQRMIPLLRQRYTQSQAKVSLLRALLNDKLFSQAAKEKDLQSIPEVQKEINEAVEKTLAKIYQKRIQAGTISEKEMVAYYEKNSEKFQIPEQIRGRRILLKSKQEAEEILGLLKAGADFGKLARERSIEVTGQKGGGQKGGKFGWVGRGGVPPAIEKVAFALEKGKVSEIIETQSGYYIVKVEDKRASRHVPFLEVKDQVKKRLEATKLKDAIDRKRKELEERYQVRLHLEFLSEVKVPVIEKIDLQNNDSIQMLREVINKAIERPYY